MSELVTLVDEGDNVIGKKDRETVSDNDRWRVSQIWVTDTKGRILIAKRVKDKKIQPGRWEPGASGTVTYPNSYEKTAQIELYEELGIKRKNLTLEKVIFWKSTLGSRACGLFRAVVDLELETIKVQAEEISEVKWMAPKDLTKDYLKRPEKYVVEFGQLLEYYKAWSKGRLLSSISMAP